MTDDLKYLLEQYGILTMALSELERQRPGTKHNTLEDYDKSLGPMLPDEPILVVGISKDGEFHISEELNIYSPPEPHLKNWRVTVWKLPEDEFYFFRAFRPALFDLTKSLPLFIYELGIIHAYSMFEGYLTEIIRSRMLAHPLLMGTQRQISYRAVFEADSKEALIEELIEREIRDLFYLPLLGVLEKMTSVIT